MSLPGFPHIYDGSFVAEIGMKYTKTVLCKTGFSFPWSRNVFSACFVRSATGNEDAKEYYCIIWTNINPESKVFLCIYYFIYLYLNMGFLALSKLFHVCRADQ